MESRTAHLAFLGQEELIELVQEQASIILEKEEIIQEKEEIIQEKEEIIQEKEEIILNQEGSIQAKEACIAYLKQMYYGQKRERFTEVPHLQGELFWTPSSGREEPVSEVPPEEPVKPKPSKRKGKRKPSLRGKIPDHIPHEVIELDPDIDLEGLTKIGEESHVILQRIPARVVVIKFIRNKYCDPKNPKAGVYVADLPDNVIGKLMADSGLLAQVTVDKFVYHTPAERISQQFSQEGLEIAKSTIVGWHRAVAKRLFILWILLQETILNGAYLQVDETRIPVQDPLKSKLKGKHHLGYYWVYSDPVNQLVMFDYQKGRSRDGPMAILEGFKGALQTDGYVVYDIFENFEEIELHGCWAHVRRYFHKAKKIQPNHANHVLHLIQKLYAVEKKLRKDEVSFETRVEVRQEESVPILDELKIYLETHPTIPECPWHVAVNYALNRWDRLIRFTKNGAVEIDNNLVENRIRPVALGRKNYLFAGSHDAARDAAILYSLMSTCKLHGVNYVEWLKDVLERIPKTPKELLPTLLPHYWKAEREAKLAKAA